jgi:hypothetical protein
MSAKATTTAGPKRAMSKTPGPLRDFSRRCMRFDAVLFHFRPGFANPDAGGAAEVGIVDSVAGPPTGEAPGRVAAQAMPNSEQAAQRTRGKNAYPPSPRCNL